MLFMHVFLFKLGLNRQNFLLGVFKQQCQRRFSTLFTEFYVKLASLVCQLL